MSVSFHFKILIVHVSRRNVRVVLPLRAQGVLSLGDGEAWLVVSLAWPSEE